MAFHPSSIPRDPGPRLRGRRPALGVCTGFAMLASLAGCVTLRPTDDERVGIAKEAVELADQLRLPETDPFTAMEQNVDSVHAAWVRIDSIQSNDRENTFYDVLGDLDRAGLLDELTSTGNTHLLSLALARGQVATAQRDIRDELDRQEVLTAVVGAPSGSGLVELLAAVDGRLAWLDHLQSNIANALTKVGRLDLGVSTSEQIERAETLTAGFAGRLAAVEDFVERIRTDTLAAAAGQLLLRSGQEVAEGEQQRLAELRLYLKKVTLASDDLEARNNIYFTNLFFPALARLSTRDEFVATLDDIATQLDTVKDRGILDLLAAIRDDAATLDRIDAQQAFWGADGHLDSFISNSIAGGERDGIAALKDAVASLGILLFVEEPKDRAVAIELARERHLRSIRLSRINSQQRITLFRQVAEALQIYYTGGISPGELAQTVLFAAHVLSLGFIGLQL